MIGHSKEETQASKGPTAQDNSNEISKVKRNISTIKCCPKTGSSILLQFGGKFVRHSVDFEGGAQS